jgi:hypothetical protein
MDDLAPICSTPFGVVGRNIVFIVSMGCTHGYSWFDPFRIIDFLRWFSGKICISKRPRSGQTMISPRCNRGFWKSILGNGNPERVELLINGITSEAA